MWATVWIAAFTFVLAIVGYLQWTELDESGKQTDRMILLYRQQVNQLSRQAGDTHDLADQAKVQATEATIAANAAKQSADVAKTTLIATNRPWLDLEAHLAGPLTLNEEGEARIPVEVDTENVGHSPAVGVSDAQSTIQVILLTPSPWHELRKVCDQATGQSMNPHNRGVTQTIFPGKPYQQLINLGLSKQEVNRSIRDLFPTAGRDPYIHPVIIWCAAYRADFSDTPHRIGYVWELKRRTPSGIGFIERNTTVPLSDLILERSWPVPPFAD
jgi:hypothetical protein